MPRRNKLNCWHDAPKERSVTFFRSYAAVARAMQEVMRTWVREWLADNGGILKTPETAYPILFFVSTDPCRAKPTNFFTYDVQETEMMAQAIQSATKNLPHCLEALSTADLSWKVREMYFPYRSKEIANYILENCRSGLYPMFNAETKLMDQVLKFALINVPKLGFDQASLVLQSNIEMQLKRFSHTVCMSSRTGELIAVASSALCKALQNLKPIQKVAALGK